MGNTSQKVLELIETRLEVSESPLEKKISNEYHYLKKSQDTFFCTTQVAVFSMVLLFVSLLIIGWHVM